MSKNIEHFANQLGKQPKGNFKQEFKKIKSKAKKEPINALWFGGDLYDHLPFPIFSIDKSDRKTIRNWNRACVKYYDIPTKNQKSPNKYSIEDLFTIIESKAITEMEKKVISQQRLFYNDRVKIRTPLNKNETDTISVYMPKSKGSTDYFRDFHRIISAYFTVIDSTRILVVFMIAPLENLLTKNELINFLNN
jgi:hypothetical protein